MNEFRCFSDVMNVSFDARISKWLTSVRRHSIGNIIPRLSPPGIIELRKWFSNSAGHNHVMFGVLVVSYLNCIWVSHSFKWVLAIPTAENSTDRRRRLVSDTWQQRTFSDDGTNSRSDSVSNGETIEVSEQIWTTSVWRDLFVLGKRNTSIMDDWIGMNEVQLVATFAIIVNPSEYVDRSCFSLSESKCLALHDGWRTRSSTIIWIDRENAWLRSETTHHAGRISSTSFLRTSFAWTTSCRWHFQILIAFNAVW